MNSGIRQLVQSLARAPEEIKALTTYNTLIAAAVRKGLEAVHDKPEFDNRELVIYDSHYTASGIMVYVRDDVDGKTYTVEIQQQRTAKISRV